MAVGSIDLSRVNISLAEFQKMSDGKYNAGEVKLSSETGLKKVNNHVHRLGANKVDISHEEVLAIKEAFVKALSSNGVDKKEINRVRGELGLAPDNGVDTQLHKRSITPLTRQQIREIIDRTTAFNTLFPDMKSIGVSAKNTNREIADAVNDYLTFAEETEAAWEKQDYDTHKALCRQGSECAELFNWTGATIQECRRAVKSGQTLPKAPGMTDITAELEGASGLGNAGKTQFLGDIHRAEIPSDPLTGKGLIEPENAVFRFNIGGQEFVGKVCGEKEKDNDQNRGIATAVENFCNAKVHPVQTNAVFFALAQGGLVPQMSLAEHGYKAADHTAVSYTLTKDADTGTVNIKYSNPEGSPLKFSWTATVDVNGKVVATPIQIEE